MGDAMPYMMTKGPVWQFFDDWFSGANPDTAAGQPVEQARLQRKIDALIAAHLGDDLLGAAPNPQPADGSGIPPNRPGSNDPNNGKQQRKMPDGHFKDWFEIHEPDPDDETKKYDFVGSCPNEPVWPWLSTFHPAATGWWNDWAGDAQAIVREAFIRAIEVSLGLDHVPPMTNKTEAEVKQAYEPSSLSPSFAYERNWTLEFWWVCPLPSFQTAISWRGEVPAPGESPPDPTAGLVTVTFLTPGLSSTRAEANGFIDKEDLVSDLLRNPGPGGGVHVPPDFSNERIGSWIAGHRHTKDAPPRSCRSQPRFASACRCRSP